MKILEDIKKIKGIGDKNSALMNKIGIYTIEDLFHYYPRTYIRYDNPVLLDDLLINQYSSFRLTIKYDFDWKKTKTVTIGSGIASDGQNDVSIVFFNTPFYKKNLIRGASYIFYGRLIKENNRFRLEQPSFYSEVEYSKLMDSYQPVYSLTKGLSNKFIQKSIKTAFENYDCNYFYNEYLPNEVINEYELISRVDALKYVHFPESTDALNLARKRLKFDELFIFLYMLKKLKDNNVLLESPYKMIETSDSVRFTEGLPFDLTKGQKDAFADIVNDLTSGNVMNRLIQGDVGSGKTIVAVLSLLMCVANGYQGAFMAPTEILAEQHYKNIVDFTSVYKLPFNPVLLTGSSTAKQKDAIYKKIETGEYNLIIGTHALIQEKVRYKNLALVVTDEQHRFGVRQRQALSEKGDIPHVLVMSATPIPRTLAIVLYGDMHLSTILDKPSNRLPIKNCVVNTGYRKKAYDFIKNQIDAGHQAYIICPMVEPSDGLENVENVVEYSQKIKKEFGPSIRIETLHGKMKPDVKNRIMNDFANKNIDILVATTVIEVGIDVPNSTVIMIENAERFGLSQLHQLRGRVGRGDAQSYSIFIDGLNKKNTNKRLDALNKSNDGFYIAKEDLKLRGAGDLFGIRQSGEMNFDIADIYEDSELILRLNETVERILSKDSYLKTDEYAAILSYINDNSNKFVDFGTI